VLLLLLLSGCAASTAASGGPSATTVPKTYRATVLDDAPAAYWPMDETSGGIMDDATGNGNNGQYAGTFALGQPGPHPGDGNTAVAFDGLSGSASVPNSTSLQMNTVSIELWVKMRTDNEYGVYVAKNVEGGGGAGSSWFQLLNNRHTGRLEFRVTSDGDPAIISASTLALNTWYYVVATYDGTVAKLFVNGTLDGSLTVAATPKQTADPLFIGRRGDGLFNNVVLDDVAIYPTALSAARIAAHWRAASGTR